MLNVLDARSDAVFSAMVKKGEDDNAVAVVAEASRFTGRARVISVSDQEKKIKKPAKMVRDNRNHETVLLHAFVGSSASAGIERANQEVATQCRKLRSRTEEVYSIQFDMDHKLIPWLARHAVEFAETVHHRDSGDIGKTDDKWRFGVRLGKSMSSDEHCIGSSARVK